ncbi:serine hydrolase domain-containing protein [Nitrospirillum iridis]|uniref:CubicO group peptidase (Beta-lactamase class C family) n=1 Tax=Nitrospirillum iridis TaxID=765888 RepID=A0A7X0AWZ9_9PROT|nr:serine hydrolase domain-containing protein [Nitrospirillum iridis]MBB6251267.1 CubicO group peptidase (beta-lactamase class C family) [Nitrospirillum iridis]
MDSVALIDADGGVTVSGASDRVPWWSFTKTVLAIAALRLVEHGLLSLDGKVAGESYTLAHLLRHQAGLPDYGGLARYHEDVEARKSPWPVGRLLQALDVARPRYEPGAGWAYSNIGYLKIRGLIETTTGGSLADALDRLVFGPAGLTTARLATQPADLADVRMGPGGEGYHPGWVYHGLVTGTAADAARLLKELMVGPLLRPVTFAAMLERHALPEYRNGIFKDPAYGLGLMLNAASPLDHPIGHRGAGPGSTIAVYAQGQRACAIWQASAQDPDLVVDKVFQRLALAG